MKVRMLSRGSALQLLRDERGAVSAEFAIALPAVLVVLSLVIGAVLITAQRVVLVSAAADVARLEARGDHALARERIGALPVGAAVMRGQRGGLHCVTLRASPGAGPLAMVEVAATACAARSESEEGDR